ncbi:Shedu immune nuclease family protein [Pseudomonas chlororaphis]|nr:Shedu immune nuclease family protein [Pseudomonas chlororaphis]
MVLKMMDSGCADYMGKKSFKLSDFVDSLFLSEDLRKARPHDVEKLATALSIKLSHPGFAEEPKETAEYLLCLLEEKVEQKVYEVFGGQVSNKAFSKKCSSDPVFRSFITATIRARKSLSDLIDYVDAEEPDLPALGLVGQVVEAIEDFNSVVVTDDVLPLIERGIYASDVARALEVWATSREAKKGDEGFWQEEFESRKGVLERLLGGHAVLLQSEFHVAGTDTSGAGGLRADFAFLNKTNNISLVEIKAPDTKLLGSKYRGTYPLSKDVSGAISQVLIQRSELMKHYFQKQHRTPVSFEVFSPRCFLIAGNLDSLEADPVKLKAFEVQRQAVASHVNIVTFDELYQQFATFNQM